MARRRLDSKLADPKLTPDQLTEKVREEEERRQKELTQRRIDAAIAPFLQKEVGGGSPVGEEAVRHMRDECRKKLREIRRLLHPNRLAHHPVYQKLTEKQKETLQVILLQALAIKPEELGFPPGYVEHDLRTPAGLDRVLEEIRAILNDAGIDVDVRWEIQGETLVQQLAWLEKETRRIEQDKMVAANEMLRLADDSEVNRKRNVLANPATCAQAKQQFREDAAKQRQQADALEADLAWLFAADLPKPPTRKLHRRN
jgi:hypothetical protein